MAAIDLNADMGEFSNEAERACEAALMPFLTTCSIACGGHAGDTETMRETVRRARNHGVRVGAHPSYPDRKGFGRIRITIGADDLRQSLSMQITALKNVLAAETTRLTHIKPHGALYNDAALDPALADLIASLAGEAVLVGPPGSALETAARRRGVIFAREGFVDRRYLASGALAPRSEPDAIINDTQARVRQALYLANGAPIKTGAGDLTLRVDTLCIHSDSPGAVETATSIRAAFAEAGVQVEAFA